MTSHEHMENAALSSSAGAVLPPTIDDDLMLRLLERRIVSHALEMKADEIFRRYLVRYIVPLIVAIAAVAGFLGWQIRDTVKDALASIESNRSTVERLAGEARIQAQQSATTLKEANGQLQSIIETRIAFAAHLATIAQQGVSITDRARQIDSVATVLSDQQRVVAAQLNEARGQAKSATEFRDEVTSRRTEVDRAVAAAKNAEQEARKLVTNAAASNQSAELAAKLASGAATDATKKLSEIDRLRIKADKLLNVGNFEVVVLRSTAQSAEIKLANIVSEQPGSSLTVSFATKEITPRSFPLYYTVDGQSYSQPLPSMTEEDRFPFRFPMQGSDGQYEIVVDLIYSFRTAPDFVILHVKPRGHA
jgi:ethanolamine utilization protein EutQ (cupin superfamily)